MLKEVPATPLIRTPASDALAPRDGAIPVQTPEGIEFVLYPAGFPIRACAFGIDTLIQWFLLVALSVLVEITGNSLGVWLMFLAAFGINWFYFMAWEVLNRGQSLGKRILGIRVVLSDGSPVNPGASFLRNLLRFADTFLYFYGIVLICIAASPGFRRLGDWAADTLVVYTSHALVPIRQPRKPWIGEFPRISPPRPLAYQEKQAILMFARRYPLLGKARADEIASSYVRRLRGEEVLPENPAQYLLGIAHTIGGADL